MAKTNPPTRVDDYISQFPGDVRAVFEGVRAVIRRAAPDAEEVIGYRIPAFKQHGILVYFAGWRKHVGLYPPISGDPALENAVARYAGPKGDLQFPLDEPMPIALIERVVRLRVRQDAERAEEKRNKKSQASPKPRASE